MESFSLRGILLIPLKEAAESNFTPAFTTGTSVPKDSSMQQLLNLISTRRSVRRYTDIDIEANDLARIVKAGLMAPSSMNSRPWHFIIVEGKDRLEQLSQCKAAGAAPIAGAKIAIVVTADATLSEMWIEDSSIAAAYMQLEAEELGLGSCWIQVRGRLTADNQLAEDYVQQMLGIPETVSVECILALGHKNEMPEPHNDEELLWERVHINEWKDK